jgi:hypothetical protein
MREPHASARLAAIAFDQVRRHSFAAFRAGYRWIRVNSLLFFPYNRKPNFQPIRRM